MLAEYILPFPSTISILDEEPVLLGTDDDFFNHDADMIRVIPDDSTLDGLLVATGLDFLQDDQGSSPLQQLADDHWNTCNASRSKAEGAFGSSGGSSHPLVDNRSTRMFGSPGSDYLSGAYLGLLQDRDHAESEAQIATDLLQSDLDLACNIEVSDSDDSVACSTTSVVNSLPGSPKAKRKKLGDLKWSEMDSDEQERALDLLRNAITDQASIREQLELLRITGQDMTVLPTDSRFHIDAANIDDSKLQRIREYLSRMALHTSAASDESTVQELDSSPNMSRHKKPFERRTPHKTNRRRRSKPHQPEKQPSNLFDREEVLSLQLQDDDDDEEINIID